jgi:hypothetical protein
MCGALSFENHSEMRRTEPRDREGAVDPKVFSDTGSRSTGIEALAIQECLPDATAPQNHRAQL